MLLNSDAFERRFPFGMNESALLPQDRRGMQQGGGRRAAVTDSGLQRTWKFRGLSGVSGTELCPVRDMTEMMCSALGQHHKDVELVE